jgi:tetratricopeptide (TPR) repeat protein
VRWVTLLGLLSATAPAVAKPAPEVSTFWREIVEPHADQVRVLKEKARNAMLQADVAAKDTDAEWAVDQRRKFYTAALDLLRHAHQLAPDNTEVLAMIGRAAEELGKIREATQALETVIRILGPDKAPSDVTGRLGAIYLRAGDRDRAIRWLRYAQTPIGPNAAAVVHLANALAARGEMNAALDTLQNALPARSVGYFYTPDVTLIAFALAVVYDRDEQPASALETLEHMQTTLTSQYAQQVGSELYKLRFAPAEDEHYYRGLLYESLGHYIEARAEWALYAASGESPWRPRALDHIAAIDKRQIKIKPLPVRRP